MFFLTANDVKSSFQIDMNFYFLVLHQISIIGKMNTLARTFGLSL